MAVAADFRRDSTNTLWIPHLFYFAQSARRCSFSDRGRKGMDSIKIEKRRTGKIEPGTLFRISDIHGRARLVSDFALFRAVYWQIYDEFLDSSDHQVVVEWVFQYDRRTTGYDPEPGSRGGDDSHFPKLRSKTGAEIPRRVACTRRSLGSRAFRHNALALVFCGPSGLC